VLAIDKPAGLPMHTTAKFLAQHAHGGPARALPEEPMQIAHRIDRETSGVLLVARTREAAGFLKVAFARRQIQKTYLALVKGAPPDEGVIDWPLALLDTKTHLLMGRAPAGRGLVAVTRFRVVRRFAAHALVEASPRPAASTDPRPLRAARPSPRGRQLYGPARRCSCAPAMRA